MRDEQKSISNAEYAQVRGARIRDGMVNPLHEPEAIGQRLRMAFQVWRTLAPGKPTQKEFFRRAGIAPNTGSNWLTGKERPRVDEAIRLCEVYNLTLDFIYRGDPSGLRYDMRDAVARLAKG